MSPFEQEADDEWAAQRLQHRLSVFRAQRPERLTDRGPIHPDVAAWGKRLLASNAGNLLIGGPVGTGKTWNVWETLETAVAGGYRGRVLFASAAQWRDTISPPVDRETLHRMWEADVVVLDDLGSSRVNEWERECLLGVVDERWSHARPIAVTFNVESLRVTLGERIASRLADGATRVALDGDDRRRAR